MTSNIEWTDETWNPTRGCSRVSSGCDHCYAIREARRKDTPGGSYEGLTRVGKRGLDWSGIVRLIPSKLDEPLRWRKPRRVFVNSMSDLFHEALPDEAIDRVFAVMAWCRRHTYQVLTKRPERMRAYSAGMAALSPKDRTRRLVASMYRGHPAEYVVRADNTPDEHVGDLEWPLRCVWLGTSVEDQATADQRVPLLLQTPAAVRWVSYEPALGPVRFHWGLVHDQGERLHWIVIGGESGPGARPFDVAWARSTVAQCKAAGVPAFVKQLGARPLDSEGRCNAHLAVMKSRKGGDMAEWPEDLRVREFPA